jgi:aspartate aminotransferase
LIRGFHISHKIRNVYNKIILSFSSDIMEEIESPSFFIGKKQERLISFGAGQPDLPPPKECFTFLKEFKDFQYGLVQGNLNLRTEVAKQYPDAGADNIVITNGASEAIDLSLRALYQPGAKILLPRPYYYSYPYAAMFAHMDIEYYDLIDGKIDIDNFKKKIRGCRAVMINSPSNPTGTIQDIDTLKSIEDITQEIGVYVISDEVYKDIMYVRENYLIKGPNVLTINSFSKTFSMCGARVGYIYARNKDWIDKIVSMKTHTSMNTSIVSQEMAYHATLVPKEFVTEQQKVWEKRKNLLYNGLVNLGLDVWNPEGAFYLFPKLNNPNKVMHDLYHKYKMVVYDGAWFGDSERVRFSYALEVEKIEDGLKRLEEYIGKEYKVL